MSHGFTIYGHAAILVMWSGLFEQTIKLLIIDYNCFWNIHCFTFFPYKSIRNQLWPGHKIGQPRVIIWTNLVVSEHPMLNTKFQGHTAFGSGEDFKGFYHIWTWQPSWSYDVNRLNKLSFPHLIPIRLHVKCGLQSAQWFKGEDVWKCWHTYIHTRTDDKCLLGLYKCIDSGWKYA